MLPRSSQHRRRGSALVIILAFMTLLTMLVVSLVIVARNERTCSHLAMERAQAEVLADTAADIATERLREAIDAGRQTQSDGYTTWSSEPGQIHVWKISGAGSVTRTSHDMFSATPGPDALGANVDLNLRTLSGQYPITGTLPGEMKVGWMNILANPAEPASAANPVVGRIAFWVDDDSCKVNINTADGSAKNVPIATQIAEKHYSYGFGVPTEISLQAFPEITREMARNVSELAEKEGFNSTSEIARAAGVPTDLYHKYKFSLTNRSKSPELTMCGEPRAYLFPVTRLFDGTRETRNAMCGGYSDYCSTATGAGVRWLAGGPGTARGNDALVREVSEPIDFVYPTAAQLPAPLPLHASSQCWSSPLAVANKRDLSNHGALADAANMAFLRRIGNAILGKRADGSSFAWPMLAASTTAGFATKYSLRQVDSLLVQLFDLCNTTVLADQVKGYSLPTIAIDGIMNTDTDPTRSRTVSGLGRGPKLTEIFIDANSSRGTINGTDVAMLQMKMRLEFYLPKYYGGAPLHSPYGSLIGFKHQRDFSDNVFSGMNLLDGPAGSRDIVELRYTSASTLNGYWMNQIFRVTDASGAPAGVDLMGHSCLRKDPDQASAALYHPYRYDATQTPPAYMGGITATITQDRAVMQMPAMPAVDTNPFVPGMYYGLLNLANGNILYPSKPGVTELRLRGGFTYWSRSGDSAGNSGNFNQWETAPIDCLRTAPYTTETQSEYKDRWMDAVIPVELDLPVPSAKTLLLRTRDPLVNKFPGDWERLVDPDETTEFTMSLIPKGNVTYSPAYYLRGALAAYSPDYTAPVNNYKPDDKDGDNPGYRPSGGGDPLSVWLPQQDSRYPKQSRFPSIGALNSIRTGIIPDDLATPLKEQKGVPWRCLNFSPSSAPSQSVHGAGYPDWAMLDFFTVPFLPQRPYRADLLQVPTPIRKLTSGGATEGRLNINNPRVPYPFSQTWPGVTQTPPERLMPLRALFQGLTVSRTYDIATSQPINRTLDAPAAMELAAAIQAHLADRGPFMLPGELANVPEIGNGSGQNGTPAAVLGYTYDGVAEQARSRNDLLRQVQGAVTTQSNNYTIWVVTQTVKKSIRNTNYGTYEPGDMITSEVRRNYSVERCLETGIDGVPGNAKNPGPDGVIGTADDPIDPLYHPAMTYPLPYRWRITHVEDSAQ